MDCHGQWISLTTVKYSCQDQVRQRTETPANRLSAAVSITREPWVHRSKGREGVCTASCVDFHWFINLFSHELRECANRKTQRPVSLQGLSWATPCERKMGKLRAHHSPWHCSFLEPCQQMCHSWGEPLHSLIEGRRWKDKFWTFSFAQLPFHIKLIRNWFSETQQAWLKLLSSFINRKWRPGGKKCPERHQNNHTHERWVNTQACFCRKCGYQLVSADEPSQPLLPSCPHPTSPVIVVLSTLARAEVSTQGQFP